MDSGEFPDFYDILGIESNASLILIKQQYHQLCLLYHPDKQTNNTDSHHRFNQVNTAYKVLSDVQLKHEYDLQYVTIKNGSSVAINDNLNVDEMDENDDGYCYSCRCGGDYVTTKETTELPIPSLIVCCDTCSLCIQVLL